MDAPEYIPKAMEYIRDQPESLFRQDRKAEGGGRVGTRHIGLSPLLILTLCGSECALVVSTEPPDDLSCLTTPGVGRPGDGLLPVPLTRCIQRGGGG